MLNQTQIDWVKSKLIQDGRISRNECLRNYISRLGAIISRLKEQGWEFDAKYVEHRTLMGWSGKDYVYIVKKYPKDIEEQL